MRYLCIDFGTKRTGLAVGDDETGIVSPLDVVEHSSADQQRAGILKEIEKHAPDALVVGLPLNMDGTEGAASVETRKFAAALQQRTGLSVDFQDERLTSDAAESMLAQSGLTHKQKKRQRDAHAAAQILTDYLESRRPPGN